MAKNPWRLRNIWLSQDTNPVLTLQAVPITSYVSGHKLSTECRALRTVPLCNGISIITQYEFLCTFFLDPLVLAAASNRRYNGVIWFSHSFLLLFASSLALGLERDCACLGFWKSLLGADATASVIVIFAIRVIILCSDAMQENEV